MSFYILNAIFLMAYYAANKYFFTGLDGASYYIGLTLCVVAAKLFSSKKDDPAGDTFIMNALIPLAAIAMIAWSLWRYVTPEVTASPDSDIAQAESFISSGSMMLICAGIGGTVLAFSVGRLLNRR